MVVGVVGHGGQRAQVGLFFLLRKSRLFTSQMWQYNCLGRFRGNVGLRKENALLGKGVFAIVLVWY